MSSVAQQQQKFTSLRRRLDQLGYKQPLGVESLPLVERLFADLVHTTESLKNAKLQLSRSEGGGADGGLGPSPGAVEAHVETYKNENARLVKENTDLHLQLVKLKDECDTKLSDVKATLRRLEHENNDLRFLNNQYVHKVRTMERESLEKAEKILRLQEKNFQAVVQTPGGKTRGVPFRRQRLVMDCAAPPPAAGMGRSQQAAAVPPRDDPVVVNLLAVADERIAQLQADCRRYANESEVLENKTQNFRKQLEARDAEIDRLGRMLDGGRPYDVVALESRSRSNEKLIAHLNIQVDYLQQKNRDLERRLDEALAVEKEARRHAADSDLKKAELEVELKDVDRMARRLQIDKDAVVDVADKELAEAKVELEKSRRELESMDLEVAQLRAEHRRLEEDNASLEARLRSRDADVQRLDDLLARVQADKRRLGERVTALVSGEKELVLEVDRLKQRKGMVRQGKSPNRMDAFIKGIEMERDYWKQEVDTLQELLRRHKSAPPPGDDSPTAAIGSCGGAARSRSSSGARSPALERRAARGGGGGLHSSGSSAGGSRRLSRPAAASSPQRRRERAAATGVDDSDAAGEELRRLRVERDELQAVLDQFEKHMSEIQSNVKVLTAERDRLATQYEEARDELQRLRHDLLRSPKSAKTSLAAQAVLRRVETERDDAISELRRAVVERDTLRERLKVATETLVSDRSRFEQRAEDMQVQLDQVLAERNELDGGLATSRGRIDELEEEMRAQLRRNEDAVADIAQHKAAAIHARAMLDEVEKSLREHQQRLQVKDGELRSTEERCRALDERLAEAQRAAQQHRDEASALRASLHGLDREKDELQAAADERAERCAALDDELTRRDRELDEAREAARELERRLERGDEALGQRERELRSLRKQLDAAAADLAEAARGRDAAARENRRAHDDLATMTRENQALHAELQESGDERERLADQARDCAAELKHVEQLLAAKEEERNQLLAQYRLLTMESEKQGSQCARLETESSGLRRELALRDADLKRSREQGEALEAEVREHLHAQRALEGQVGALQRGAASLEERVRELELERHELQQDVAAARDLAAKLEIGRDQAQRAVAARSAELEQAQRVVDEVRHESAALRGQLSGERQSAKGLEALLASTREKEFSMHMSKQEKESELQLLRDRLTLNETKIESQAREIAQLRARNAELENDLDRQRRQLTNERYEKERAVQEALRLGGGGGGSAGSSSLLASASSRLAATGRDSPPAGHRSSAASAALGSSLGVASPSKYGGGAVGSSSPQKHVTIAAPASSASPSKASAYGSTRVGDSLSSPQRSASLTFDVSAASRTAAGEH